jgi:hypothetical protein
VSSEGAPGASTDVVVGAPTVEVSGGLHRVSAIVDGSPLWFESRDVSLAPSPEAFLSALLIPALHTGRRLGSEAPVSPRWVHGVRDLLAVVTRWWDLPDLEPDVPIAATLREPASGRTALCFSGGADSFHALLHGDLPVDDLVFVNGFDLLMAEKARADAERSMRTVAERTGKGAIAVHTNLRTHPVMRNADWERGHGGTLAAVGHLLSERIGRLGVASSYPYALDLPWGSHWRIDPLWSSERLEVVHTGAKWWRSEKVRAIAADPLVHVHLEVCVNHRPGEPNCSRCEKCVRTMLVLEASGHLPSFTVFRGGEPLSARVDALAHVAPGLIRSYGKARSLGLDARTDRAVRRLVWRSHHRQVMRRFEHGSRRPRRRIRRLGKRLKRRGRRLVRRMHRFPRRARRLVRRARRRGLAFAGAAVRRLGAGADGRSRDP